MYGLPKIEIGKIYTDGKGNYREVLAISDGPSAETPQIRIAYQHTVKGKPRTDVCCWSTFRAFARQEWKEEQ